MTYVRTVILVILVFGCVIYSASALTPDDIRIFNSSKRWVVANGSDSANITLVMFNLSTGQPVNNSYVTFSVNDSLLGTVSSPSPIINGTSRTTFHTKIKSGTALITANISYYTNDSDPNSLKSMNLSLTQLIDHDIPAKIPSGGIILPPDGEERVGNYTPIGILIQDNHANPVDNRREVDEGREAEKVLFSVTGSPGAPNSTAYFMPGAVKNLTAEVNGTGWAMTTFRLDIRPGPNIIKIDPLTFVPDLKRTIFGVADGMPWFITSRISTSEGFERNYTLADGIQKFYILYKVEDEYHNGVQLKDILINTDIGENSIVTTNATGYIGIDYGPKSDMGDVYITARTAQNSSVWISDLVRFVNLTANDMIFTASPQSMASYDAKKSNATLQALVIDSEGNPIPTGERVKFTLSNIQGDIPNMTAQPSLRNETDSGKSVVWATTNDLGIATVYLKPCSFMDNESAQTFKVQATATCTVAAEWVNPNGTIIVRYIPFTFKNYPYLSVMTSVDQSKVNVSGTVNVTLTLKGDGFLLDPKPVDVMLVIDKSGSMESYQIYDEVTKKYISRMQAAKNSANNFTYLMNSTTDRIGLVAFDFESTSAPNQSLTNNFPGVRSKINALDPNGGATAMRSGIKRALDHMIANPNSDPRAIRAIIVMTDGNWNNGGSPLAVGKGYSFNSESYEERDLGVHDSYWNKGFTGWAKYFEEIDYRWYDGLGGNITGRFNNVPVVYEPAEYDAASGAFVGPIDIRNQSDVYYCTDGQFTNQNMSIYADNNGIKIYAISFAMNIPQEERDALTTLANSTGGFYRHAPTSQELTEIYAIIAGDLRKHAGVNTTSNVSFQNVVVKNVTVPGADTFDYQFINGISTFIERWKTGFSPTYQTTRNDTQNWTTHHSFNFNDIGTMDINDNWQVTFSLRVLREGDIHVFDPDSVITFDDGTKSLHIPDTVINAIANLRNESFDSGEFYEEGINVTQISSTRYEWTWNRTYTGEKPVQEYYFISLDGGYQWTLVGDTLLNAEEARNEVVGHFIYDIQNLLPHGADLSEVTVDFKLKAYAIDSASPRAPRGPQIVRLPTNVTYITLE